VREAEAGQLVWALITATAASDHDGREVLLDALDDQELMKAVVTGLAAAAAGVLLAGAPSREAGVEVIRRFAFEEAVRREVTG